MSPSCSPAKAREVKKDPEIKRLLRQAEGFHGYMLSRVLVVYKLFCGASGICRPVLYCSFSKSLVWPNPNKAQATALTC